MCHLIDKQGSLSYACCMRTQGPSLAKLCLYFVLSTLYLVTNWFGDQVSQVFISMEGESFYLFIFSNLRSVPWCGISVWLQSGLAKGERTACSGTCSGLAIDLKHEAVLVSFQHDGGKCAHARKLYCAVWLHSIVQGTPVRIVHLKNSKYNFEVNKVDHVDLVI